MEEAQMLRSEKVGVIPTDTLYGVVASTAHEQAVERVYALKKRTPTKPSIILISAMSDLEKFGIVLTEERQKILSRYWPGPVSIILECGKEVPSYLHRNTYTLAFRLPQDDQLRALLKESGPLIAPSANPEGLSPATTVEEAKKYFGSDVDFYINGGKRAGAPSTIITIDEQGEVKIVREGRG